ncbi:jg8331 [Pararge aegeria aegeria]|uniref:Jg8331 protein n=1 Tax=Pararge aegeria aegeria TaxID=348720 RepID=A0A8S4SNA8_9NEOP|nr:jg8331 [Pararge aegeria aegeria]
MPKFGFAYKVFPLQRILEYFGYIARRDGDNLEKIVVTGKETQKERDLEDVARFFGWNKSALLSTPKCILLYTLLKVELNGTKSSERSGCEGVTNPSNEENDVERDN